MSCHTVRLSLFLMVLTLALSGCAVRNYDPAPGFSAKSLRTVKLKPAPTDDGNVYHTSIFNERMAAALKTQLRSRGIATGTANPDAIVSWQLSLDPANRKISSYDLQQRYWRRHYGFGLGHTSERTYPVGVLMVDFLDPKDPQRLLLRAWDELILTEPAISEKDVRRAVDRICRGLDAR